MFLSRPLILASLSPRRKEILQSAGFTFRVEARPTTEAFPPDMPSEDVPVYLAAGKAACFGEEFGEAIVLCADTVVILDEKIMNKPADEEEAFQMLSALSGKKHRVVTGVALKTAGKLTTFSDTAFVTFKELSEEEIRYYIRRCSPFDKAGSYGVQDFIGMAGIPKIEGSFYTVMGLPVHLVYQHLTPYISF